MPKTAYKSDDKRKQAYIDALGNGFNRGEAAKTAGVSRMTAWEWSKADPVFASALDDAEMQAVVAVEDALYKNATGGNLGAQVFVLCNRNKDRWQNAQRQEHTGKDGGPIVIDAMTPEERQARIDELNSKRGT